MQNFNYTEFKKELEDSEKNNDCGHCDGFQLLNDTIEYTRLHSIFYKITNNIKLDNEDESYLKQNEIILLNRRTIGDFDKKSTNQPRLNLKRSDMDHLQINRPYSIFLIPEKVINNITEYEEIRNLIYSFRQKNNQNKSLESTIASWSIEQIRKYLCFSILEFENNNNILIPNKDLTKDIPELLEQLKTGILSIEDNFYIVPFHFIELSILKKLKTLTK